MRTIRPSQLKSELRSNAMARVPSMIWGPPGLGKSQIVYQFANTLSAKVFELRANLFDPVDVRGGLKVVEQADGSYRTRYGVPEDYPDTNYQGVVVLLIDELPNAPKATQNALLQLTLDRKIGTYVLPENTVIVAAGNRSQDRAAVHEMPTPVKNRFAHYALEANIDDWVGWALHNNIDDSLISFLRYRPGLLHSLDANEYAFPSPRTWEMVSRKLPHMDNMFYGVASLVGDGPAGEYLAHRNIHKELPDIDDLIKNPSTTRVPTDPSALYAIAGALASRVDQTNFNAIMRYNRRMPREYQVVLVRDCLAKNRQLLNEQSFKDWTTDNVDVVM
jgi:hypothetical protein